MSSTLGPAPESPAPADPYRYGWRYVRRPGPDGRTVALALTPAGRRLAEEVSDARRSVLLGVLDVLDDGERVALAGVLDKLVSAVVARRLDARAAGVDPGGWLCRLCDPVACGRPQGRCPAANAAAGRS